MHAHACKVSIRNIQHPRVIFATGHRGSDPGEDVVVIVSLDFLEAALGKQHALEVNRPLYTLQFVHPTNFLSTRRP